MLCRHGGGEPWVWLPKLGLDPEVEVAQRRKPAGEGALGHEELAIDRLRRLDPLLPEPSPAGEDKAGQFEAKRGARPSDFRLRHVLDSDLAIKYGTFQVIQVSCKCSFELKAMGPLDSTRNAWNFLNRSLESIKVDS